MLLVMDLQIKRKHTSINILISKKVLNQGYLKLFRESFGTKDDSMTLN